MKTSIITRLLGRMEKHKTLSVAVILIIIISLYFIYGKLTGDGSVTKYFLSEVKKGTIVVSISGTGQVSASNQIDIKSKVSGDIVWIDAKVGQEVSQGQAIASVDDMDARKAITNAQIDLTETRLQLDKATAQAPIDYQRKLESLRASEDNLKAEYQNIFSTVSKVFLDLPSIMTGVDTVLYSNDLDPRTNQWNVGIYRNLFDQNDAILIGALADIAERDYKLGRTDYGASFIDFKNISLYSDNVILEKALSNALKTAESIAQTAKSEINLLDTIVDISNSKNRKVSSFITTYQSNLKSYLNTVNAHISSLKAQKDAVQNDRDSILNLNRDIQILRVNNPDGVKPIDLQISENGLRKKEVALADLKTALADYTIRTPFRGVVAKVGVKKGDSASNGTVIATLITKEKQAVISLNEVDVAKVKVGQKVTITFDAIPDLSIAGEVSEVDTLGTVSQGVVNYSTTITFDTQDERVKSGMTLSASIITDVKTDVLIIPNSAIKSNANSSYVDKFDVVVPETDAISGYASPTAPGKQTIQTGLSNDTVTEVLSGLKENDQVIERTLSTASTATSQSAPNIFSAAGVRSGGGNTRAVGR